MIDDVLSHPRDRFLGYEVVAEDHSGGRDRHLVAEAGTSAYGRPPPRRLELVLKRVELSCCAQQAVESIRRAVPLGQLPVLFIDS